MRLLDDESDGFPSEDTTFNTIHAFLILVPFNLFIDYLRSIEADHLTVYNVTLARYGAHFPIPPFHDDEPTHTLTSICLSFGEDETRHL